MTSIATWPASRRYRGSHSHVRVSGGDEGEMELRFGRPPDPSRSPHQPVRTLFADDSIRNSRYRGLGGGSNWLVFYLK